VLCGGQRRDGSESFIHGWTVPKGCDTSSLAPDVALGATFGDSGAIWG
jgi:hypothetical protein